jgi:MFS family permease
MRRTLAFAVAGCVAAASTEARADCGYDIICEENIGEFFALIVLVAGTAAGGGGSAVAIIGNSAAAPREDPGRIWPILGLGFGALGTIAGGVVIGFGIPSDSGTSDVPRGAILGVGIAAATLGAASITISSINLHRSIHLRDSRKESAWLLAPALLPGREDAAPGVALTLSW